MSQVEQKRREMFEAWADGQGYDLQRNDLVFYEHGATRCAWSGFQAACDAVVIELPESWVPTDAQERGWEMIGKFRAAIEAAGLKVKP